MTKILELRDRLIRFYSRYESYLFPIVKFIVAISLFCVINKNIGFMKAVSSLSVALVLSLICAILPVNAMMWIAAFVVLADMYAVSVETAITTFLLFAVIFFLYFRFAPRDGIAALLTPVCFRLHIPYIMPVGCSLLRGAYSVIAVVCGTILYYFLGGIQQNAAALMSTEEDVTQASRFDISVGQIFSNREMYLVLAVFVVTSLVVYLVRRMEVDHAWTLAIVSGTLIELSGLFVGYLVLGITGRTLWLLVGGAVSLLLAFVIRFIFMDLDYDRTERVQFEDDDYYYYVKAVPKKMVAVREVTVKHFGNTASMGKRINHNRPELTPEEEERSRKVIARGLDMNDNSLK